MATSEVIRNFYGKQLGRIETLPSGEQLARNFYGKILGRYNPKDNKTRDFYGRVLSNGNTLAGLIYAADAGKR